MVLVGFGVMGQNHARVLRRLDGMRLVAIVDPQVGREDIPGIQVLHSIYDLEKGVADALIVAAPTTSHREIALVALALEMHILVEKPLSDSMSSAMSIRDAFLQNAKVSVVGHIERFNSAVRELKSKISTQSVGEVKSIAFRRHGPNPERVRDVGAILDLASHDIDLAHFLTGSTYSTINSRATFDSSSPLEAGVMALCTMKNGITVSHSANWLSPLKERRIEVIGETGVLVADLLTSDLRLDRVGAKSGNWQPFESLSGGYARDSQLFSFEKKEPLVVELDSFRAAIEGSDTDLATLEQGLEVVRVAESFRWSAEEGRQLSL